MRCLPRRTGCSGSTTATPAHFVQSWIRYVANTRLLINNLRQTSSDNEGVLSLIKRNLSPSRRPLQGSRVATVRIGPLAEIPSVLRDLGCEPAAILNDAGFELAYFDDPDVPIPYVAGSKLIARCVAATGCEHFGLLVGMRGGPSSLGLAGFLLKNARDVGSALRDLVRHLDLHDRGGVPTLDVRDATSLLGFAIVEPGTEATGQIYDLSMAVACNIMRNLCGAHWNPTEVLLPRPRPRDVAPWTRFFRAPVRFDADQCALAFPSRWLAHPVATADPLLYRHLEKQAADLRNDRDRNLTVDVRRVVRGTVTGGKCTATRVAQLLGIHERTLNRRLRAEATAFQRVLDEVRFDMSRQLLDNTSMKLADIAAALGYTEASAFIRAFIRWSGATPQQWRRSARHVDPMPRESA